MGMGMVIGRVGDNYGHELEDCLECGEFVKDRGRQGEGMIFFRVVDTAAWIIGK